MSKTNKNTEKKPYASSDNLCKLIAEKYPQQLIEWLFGIKTNAIEVLKTELSRDPVRADSVTLLESDITIYHLEFQTTTQSHLPLALRMLDYYVALKRNYLDKKIERALVVLFDKGEEIPDRYEDDGCVFLYRVVKLWEVDLEELSKHKELLPLAALCRIKTSKENLLREVAEKINAIEDKEERNELIDMARVFAGLRFPRKMIYELLRGEDMLEESVIVQDWLKRGRREGKREGIEEGKREGIEEGLQHERHLVIRQLTRLLGKLSVRMQRKVETLSQKQLEDLGEALLFFKAKSDLNDWLEKNCR